MLRMMARLEQAGVKVVNLLASGQPVCLDWLLCFDRSVMAATIFAVMNTVAAPITLLLNKLQIVEIHLSGLKADPHPMLAS